MSSVIETFFLLFKSNADDVDKATQKATDSSKKLEHELSHVDRLAEKTHESLQDLISEVTGAFIAFASFESIREHIMETAEFADHLGELAEALDLNVTELGAWGDAVQITGGSVDSFQDSLARLTASLADFATKGRSRTAPFFKELGIQMATVENGHRHARSALAILPELADKFSKLDKNEAFGMGEKMGLDHGTIILLQKGRGAVEELIARQKELGAITKEDTETAHKFNVTYKETVHLFRSIYVALGTELLPALTWVLESIQNLATWGHKHINFIKGAFLALGFAVAFFVVPALERAVIAFSPFLLWGAVIAGIIFLFAALYEDVQAFRQGHKSLIGEMLHSWPMVGRILNGIHQTIKLITETVHEFTRRLHESIETVEKAYNKIKAVTTGVGHKIEAHIVAGRKLLGVADTSPLAAQTSTSMMSSAATSTRNNLVQTGPITIQTQATDSDQIAASFSDSLKTQMRHALNTFDDGVAA